MNQPINQTPAQHPCAAMAALWALRILVDLNGWKKMRGYMQHVTADGDLLRTIGLEHLEDKEITPADFLRQLKHQREEYRRTARIDGLFAENLQRLGNRIGLDDTERELLGFAITLHTYTGLDDIMDLLGDMTTGRLFEVLSVILEIPQQAINHALAGDGILSRSGLLRLDRRGVGPARRKFELLYGLVDLIFEPHCDTLAMLEYYFKPAGKGELTEQDFAHIGADYRLLSRYLRHTRENGSRGVNILLYGPPGTGKSELARTLARELGMELFEINTSDDRGDPMPGHGRFSAYQLSQQILARMENAMILFDEIEDVFSDDILPLFGKVKSREPHKAWINRLLEKNPRPAVWISNSIKPIDSAFLRRFDYILELKNPPRATRERILKKYLKESAVSTHWIRRAAENPHIPPALVSRAAKVAAVLHDSEAAEAEQALERILGNTLTAMGWGGKPIPSRSGEPGYRLDALNPDHDLERLLEGLRRNPQGRICLYGPPGTGKSAFGRHAARVLEKPLLVKRTSDLLDPYVGMTEKHLARMFDEAREEDAILMLDEADSLLRERSAARNSWEVTQVNELLTRMEEFDGLFICSTNLIESLDEASIRRFDLKIRFGYLTPEHAWILFRQTLSDQGTAKSLRAAHRERLSRLPNLTPGDFATAIRQNRLTGEPLTPSQLLEHLERESRFKNRRHSRGIGFCADI